MAQLFSLGGIALMKYSRLFITLALFASLLASCSKHSPAPPQNERQAEEAHRRVEDDRRRIEDQKRAVEDRKRADQDAIRRIEDERRRDQDALWHAEDESNRLAHASAPR